MLSKIGILNLQWCKAGILYYFDSGKSLNTCIKVDDLALIKNTFIKFINYKKINNAEISGIKRILGAFTVNNKKPSSVVVVQQSTENTARAS